MSLYLTPRAYQLEAINECRSKMAKGAKSVVIVSPTGSGKTCMGGYIARAHLERSEANRVVWLAHRNELLEQAAGTLRSFGLSVGVRGASPSARVQVESVQTILARGTAPEGTLLVADECHHFASSNACGTIVKMYSRIVGLTATPERGDCQPLRPPFEQLVVAAQISELTRLGHLVPLRIRAPETRMAAKKIAQRPADAYHNDASGMRAICFAPNLRAADEFRDGFVGLGYRAAVVHGKLAKDVREALLGQHKGGALDVLVNVGVLTEGYDDPAVSCVIVARGCGSQGLWLQMTGRALRPSPGKDYALLIDLRGNVHELGNPAADRVFALEGEAITLARAAANGERLCRCCKTPLGDQVGPCPVCGVETSAIPEATGADLVDIDSIKGEVKAFLKPSRIVLALAGMLRKGNTRQVTPQIAARFRGIFRHHPRESTLKEANEYNRQLNAQIAWAEEEIHRARSSQA